MRLTRQRLVYSRNDAPCTKTKRHTSKKSVTSLRKRTTSKSRKRSSARKTKKSNRPWSPSQATSMRTNGTSRRPMNRSRSWERIMEVKLRRLRGKRSNSWSLRSKRNALTRRSKLCSSTKISWRRCGNKTLTNTKISLASSTATKHSSQSKISYVGSWMRKRVNSRRIKVTCPNVKKS